MDISKSEHIISLSKEIIDDIELSRIEAQALLLKATRLARYVDDDEIRKWLRFEMQGFSNDEVSLKYMTKTGRWTDKKKMKDTGHHWHRLRRLQKHRRKSYH